MDLAADGATTTTSVRTVLYSLSPPFGYLLSPPSRRARRSTDATLDRRDEVSPGKKDLAYWRNGELSRFSSQQLAKINAAVEVWVLAKEADVMAE